MHQKSCVETPQQNGRVERKQQHILNVGRALLFQSKLPKKFWSYALVHATYIINRVSSSILKDKSPHQILFNQNPDFVVLKFLVPYVLPQLFVLIELRLPLEQERVFLLAIKMVSRVLLFFMNMFYLIKLILQINFLLPLVLNLVLINCHYLFPM